MNFYKSKKFIGHNSIEFDGCNMGTRIQIFSTPNQHNGGGIIYEVLKMYKGNGWRNWRISSK